MARFALRGEFPLVAAAEREGRAALFHAAQFQTLCAFLFLFGAAGIFAIKGFNSSRMRGWTNFAIAGGAAICVTASIFPSLTPQYFDYWVTSHLAMSPKASIFARLPVFAAIYGPHGLNSQMSPAVFLVERAIAVSLLAPFVGLLSHDIGFGMREAAEALRFVQTEESEKSDGQRAKKKASRDARESDSGQREERQREEAAFGHRGQARRALTPREESLRILGLASGASDDEIQSAWRGKMKRAHPDHGGSAEAAAMLNRARDILLRGHG